MPETQMDQRSTGLVPALQNLTDGLYNLIRKHIELVRSEVREESAQVGRNVATLVLFFVIVTMGYLLLNLAAVLFSGWFGGQIAMAITTLVLAIINLAGGGWAIVQAMKRFRQSPLGLPQTSDEIHRSRQWIKQIRQDSLSDVKQLETSPLQTTDRPA